MKLFEEFKLYENMWDTQPSYAEAKKDNNKNIAGQADTDLTEAADPNGMAYWAAEHLGDLYTMIDTKTPKAGTPAYNKKCRDANKRVKERWNITNNDESMDIIFNGYSFWKRYFK